MIKTNKNKPPFPPYIFPLLYSISLLYRALITSRILLYKFQIKKSYQAPCPVISVGNITCGGTGKSPFVIFLCTLLQNKKTLILSRGYKKKQDNDDENINHLQLKNTQRIAQKNRIQACRTFFKKNNSDYILLDDGFQHLQIKRNLNIVLIDCQNPFSNNHLLPAGLLREPLKNLNRSDIIILSKYDEGNPQTLTQIHKTLTKHCPKIPLLKAMHTLDTLICYDKTKNYPIKKETLQNKNITAFCGIGNPNSFKKTLLDLKCQIQHFIPYPDHHQYSKKDIAILNKQSTNSDYIICTQKDLTKINTKQFKQKLLVIHIKITMPKNDLLYLKKSLDSILLC
ncbi:MAG: tetraacyldisaccharide 4'-kinase [bacterium]